MIIVNKNGTLIHNKKRYKCAIGKKGITKKKKEGDKKTRWRLYVRQSVLSKIKSKI